MRNRIFFATCLAALAALSPGPKAFTRATAAPPARCDVRAYVIDKDPKGLNVRDAPGVGGKVLAVIPLDGDGTIIHLVASSPNGWVQLDHAENIDGTVVFDKKGWVSGNMLATETRGYGTRGVKLYAAARKGSTVGTVPPENEVRVAGCSGDWIKIKYKNLAGWLEPEDQCPNPVTLCN